MEKIYILGNGAMAKALALGLREKYKICMVGRDIGKLKEFANLGFEIQNYSTFDIKDKNLILAFKPYALKSMAEILKAKIKIAKNVISVLANTDLKTLESEFNAQNYARIMPNIAAEFQKSITPFILKNKNFRDEILQILSTFGQICELENETQMQAAMSISGCAPAFLALVAESIAMGGVFEGLKKDLSLELTHGLFESFSALLQNEHPALIREKICSPAGVTIKGVKALEQRAVRTAFLEAISASAK